MLNAVSPISYKLTHPQSPRGRRSQPIRYAKCCYFLAQIFGSHAGITNNGSAHTASVQFCRFGFNRPRVKWLYGCLQGNQLRTISHSNLRIKLRHHWQNLGFILSSFSSSVTLLSFFLSFFLSFSVLPCQIHGVLVRFSWDDPCLHNNNK